MSKNHVLWLRNTTHTVAGSLKVLCSVEQKLSMEGHADAAGLRMLQLQSDSCATVRLLKDPTLMLAPETQLCKSR